jgi:23S rRNA (adenine2503-C2)-methyltransferase
MAASSLRPRLAVSLHAGDDETRARIMPINRKYPLKRLMQSCRDYQAATGLQVTFEIALFKDVNDSVDDARKVLGLIRGLETKVNIIPYNPVQGLPFSPPDYARVLDYQAVLKSAGIVTMIRTQKGEDIDAACGQLRRRETPAGEAA